MTPGTNAACWSMHLSTVYAAEPRWFEQTVAAIRAGTHPVRAAADTPDAETLSGPMYRLQAGVAVIPVVGAITKGFSKFGGASAAFTRRAVRAAVSDPDVGAILLKIDSPGGSVAGIDDLAADVARAASVKPTEAYIEDVGASAAYWIASEANAIHSNPSAMVGSIGAFMVLIDSSKAAEIAGLRVLPVASGPLKAAGQPGTPITDSVLAETQALVDAVASRFFAAVKRGRQMSKAQLDAVTTGGVWPASDAKALGLLDSVRPIDEVVAALSAKAARKMRPRAAAAAALPDLGS